jgi:putative FmdB family regulatory protein
MPTYDYECLRCGGFDAIRTMAARDTPAPCPECDEMAPRVLGAAPRLALLNDGRRRAFDTNERARHAPLRSGDVAAGGFEGASSRLRHQARCACCVGGGQANNGLGSGTAAVAGAAPALRAFAGRRPWMLSH